MERRERGHTRRSARSIGIGAVAGGAVGCLIGFVIGAVFVSGGLIWAAVLGVGVAGGLLGAFWGGMASLESPDPGVEPSETEHPLRDVRPLTHEEGRGETGTDGPGRRP